MQAFQQTHCLILNGNTKKSDTCLNDADCVTATGPHEVINLVFWSFCNTGFHNEM